MEDHQELNPPKFPIVPTLLSAVALALVLYFTYTPEMWDGLKKVFSPLLISLCIFTQILRIWFSAWRLKHVSNGQLSRKTAIKGQIMWDFFANIMPPVVGGTPLASVYIAKEQGITKGEAFAIMLFTMILDQLWFALGIPILFIAGTYISVIPDAAGLVGKSTISLFFGGMLVWTAFLSYAVLVNPGILQKAIHLIAKFKFLKKFEPTIRKEVDSWAEKAKLIGKQPISFYVKGFVLTILVWLSRYALIVTILVVLVPDVSILQAFLRAMAALILGMFIPTPGGAGGLEALFTIFIGSLMPVAFIASAMVTWRFFGYYLYIIAGTIISSRTVGKMAEKKLVG